MDRLITAVSLSSAHFRDKRLPFVAESGPQQRIQVLSIHAAHIVELSHPQGPARRRTFSGWHTC